VVFFKENLSTGWDCPRAETMMSFRHAKDATYIAQLLGRMVRTPMQMHIQVDDVLNDVHLYLPYFNEDTVKDVVEALQSSEGGDIPTEIYGESSSAKRFETLTVRTKHKSSQPTAGQTAFNFSDAPSNEQATDIPQELDSETADTSSNNIDKTEHEPSNNVSNPSVAKLRSAAEGTLNEASKTPRTVAAAPNTNEEVSIPSDLFDREGVMKFINDSGLLTYNVRALRVSNYLTSLFNLAHLLSMANLYREAIRDVHADVVEMIHKYVEGLRENGKYDALVSEIKQFKLAVQTFDAFGETVDNYSVQDLFTTTDADIDRQFRVADIKLGRDGIGNAYGNVYATPDDMTSFKIDVILFAADQDCMNSLYSYAEDRFHSLNDRYRRYMATVDSEKLRRKYDSIVSDGDVVSKHNFRLPETIQVPHEAGGKAYRDHLFVSDTTGVAVLKLNAWEAGVIAEEEKRDDFVCWIRNPSRSPWSLCIPYMIDGETKSAYPDFIVVRKDNLLGYVIDILEPHNPDFKDNLGKAKGFAEYAKQNPGVGRIQLIRMSKDAAGNNRFKRLDMYQSAVRDKVTYANNTDELDHIFDTDGFFD
jgi:type III restriction enzyme